MKKLLLFCGLACLLASCSKYQINTVSSTTTKKDLNSGDFVFENDTLAIVYRFNGQNAPLRVQIKNKLNDPLYIDWKRSSLIVKDQAINYMGNIIKIGGSFESSKDPLFSNLNYRTGTLDASATLPEESSFIPPHAMIDKVLLNVTDNFLSVSDDMFQKRLAYSKKGDESFYVKSAAFTKDNSPLVFRSYLTIYIDKGKESKMIPSQQEFYISESIQTARSPKSTEFYMGDRSDVFYNSKTTGYGKVIALTAVVGVVGATAALTDATKPKDK